MLPDYRDGDFVLTYSSPFKGQVWQYKIGQVLLFRHPRYGRLIKKVAELSEDGTRLTLLGTHPDSVDSRHFGPVDAKSVLGRVIWHIGSYKQR